MPDLEAVYKGLLSNVAAKHVAAATVRPESPSVDYVTGYRDGFEAGQLAAVAFGLGALTGESPTELIERTIAQARVEAAVPFRLRIESVDQEAAN